MLSNPKKINKRLNNQLLETSSQNPIKKISSLISRGAQIDCCDEFGKTPLHLAAQNGNVDIVETLIRFEADSNKADNSGLTPIMIATREGHLEVVEKLLEFGADTNIQAQRPDGSRYTALDIAIQNNNHKVIKCLLECGANYDEINPQYKDETINQIKKIEKTKKVFAGDLSIPVEEINEKYLQYLFKQSGIPAHLLAISPDKPESQAYVNLVKKFKTSETDKSEDSRIRIDRILNPNDTSHSVKTYQFVLENSPLVATKRKTSEDHTPTGFPAGSTLDTFISSRRHQR